MEESRQAIIIEGREFWCFAPITICLINVMIFRFEKVGQFKCWLEESDKQQEVKDTGKEISLVSEKRLGCNSEHRWNTLKHKILKFWGHHKEHKSLWEDYKCFYTFPSLSSWLEIYIYIYIYSSELVHILFPLLNEPKSKMKYE